MRKAFRNSQSQKGLVVNGKLLLERVREQILNKCMLDEQICYGFKDAIYS